MYCISTQIGTYEVLYCSKYSAGAGPERCGARRGAITFLSFVYRLHYFIFLFLKKNAEFSTGSFNPVTAMHAERIHLHRGRSQAAWKVSGL